MSEKKIDKQEVIEDLMKPRYKVVADYPISPFMVGEILNLVPMQTVAGYWTGDGDRCMSEYQFKKYPYIFEKLKWWEDRKPEEMPKYVKEKGSGVVFLVKKHFSMIHDGKWYENYNAFYPQDFNGRYVLYCYTLPATETEYLNYINSKK